jgi:lipid-A-disaccharide synthase
MCDKHQIIPSQTLRLMIVAGEASGDAHAAALVRALQEVVPEGKCEFFGSTGDLMRAAGVESIVRTDDLAIIGIVEVGRVLPIFWRAFRELKRAAIERQTDAVILVDWPEFNLRLARALHRRGVKIIYYISPQLWAWRSYRIRNIRRDVDLLISILPFEKDWYAARGVTHVEYAGHPFAGRLGPRYGREEFCRRNELDPSRPIVALLPGSRHKELSRILPPMLGAAVVVSQHRPDVQFVIPVAPGRDPREAQQIISAGQYDSRLNGSLRTTKQETLEALTAADAAAVASGTATLEAALIGTPLVIVYKESLLNWHTLGRLITAEHYGLVNLIAGRRVVTELMQNDLTPNRLAQELLALLDPDHSRALRVELGKVSALLGEGGASQRAARMILDFIGSTVS